MKKTVKAMPVTAVISGIAAVICIVASIASLIEEASMGFENILITMLALGAFVFFLFKYLSQSKIEFDENTFTVDGKTYSFDEITDVTVDSEQVLRNVSTLRVKIFIGEDEICSFTKDDNGGEEFIAVMKKRGVKVSIDI